jgi:hypothetical protein
MKNPEYEKLGLFYLGKNYDPEQHKPGSELVLYDSKQLVTHAVCVGMTGSGKTGLCIALLEEAAIDGIPVIAIDPKGDLGNLLLTFPELRGEDFAPWVDPDEAARKGISREEYGEQTAKVWREGLAAWGQDGGRISRFRASADLTIYTPGSSAGLPLTVLRSFAAPSTALIAQAEAYRERVSSSVSGLLALLGVQTDLISSREHILLANVLDEAWRAGRDLDMAGLIHAVQSPPFDKVGVIDLETFFPAKDRFSLAMKLNNLIASPGFATWMEGDSLDVASLLYTQDSRPRVSILSIAHLSDDERMFFVTILLNEILAWIRTQPGTSSLRAILYMDEIFGYFPPSSKPPSKMPMLTLLKQARAFGLGIVLATQNPVDLDYKGLSNAGTWFLGRLQTKRDKERVLDGLEGATSAVGQNFDRAKIDELLSSLGNCVFLMNNVHADQPILFQSRWALSYLRGPLTREQIQVLMAPWKQTQAISRSTSAKIAPQGKSATESWTTKHDTIGARTTAPGSPTSGTGAGTTSAPPPSLSSAGSRPVLPPDVPEFFIPHREPLSAGVVLLYRPALLGVARLHYADKKAGIDHWETLGLLRPVGQELPAEVWNGAEVHADHVPELEKTPVPGAQFAPLAGPLSRGKGYGEWTKALKNFLYRDWKLTIWSCPEQKEYSRPRETQRDFRLRLAQGSRERRDEDMEKLRAKYRPKLDRAQEKIQKAREEVNSEKSQVSKAWLDAGAAVVGSVLGAFVGRKTITKTNVGKATSAAKAAGKAMQRGSGVNSAEHRLDGALREFEDLELQFRSEVEALEAARRPEALVLQPIELTPKKADITVEHVVLAWTPWKTMAGAKPEAAY